MAQRSSHEDELFGHDSFLDIVTNIVGILIVLVLVVGVRAGRSSQMAAIAVRETAGMSKENDSARIASLQAEIDQLGVRWLSLEQEIQARRREREQWETEIHTGALDLERERRALDAGTRADFDRRRILESARQELEALTREHISLASLTPEAITIEHRPTPISRVVHANEIHFHLREGRIKYVPLEELLDEFKAAARRKVWKLEGQREFTDVVGPIEGFRLRYRLERIELPLDIQLETGQTGSIVRLARWDLLPVASDLGEPAEDARREGSELERALARNQPRNTVVTLWTYADSFALMRRIRPRLYELGYLVAVRPLPDGVPIGGSPFGSKSAAQ
jgi:hypothetical protein